MLTKKLLLLLTLTLIASCQSSIERVDTSCSWTKPISTTAADRKALSRETKEEIVAHNELWKSHCGKK